MIEYRNCVVVYDPPPIGSRSCDWQWAHEDYDGDGDKRAGACASLEACKKEIDNMYENGEMDS